MTQPLMILASNAFKSALETLANDLHNALGHRLAAQYGPASVLQTRIERGEPFDAALLTAAAIDALIDKGLLDPGTRIAVAQSGAGIAMRTGLPRPNLSSAEAVKQALLNSRSVAWVGASITGQKFPAVLSRLGIADAMREKTLILSGTAAAEAVARSEAELGVTQISEILPVAGVQLAGPLPPELQFLTDFHAALAVREDGVPAGRAFLAFLRSPPAMHALRESGLDPAPSGAVT